MLSNFSEGHISQSHPRADLLSNGQGFGLALQLLEQVFILIGQFLGKVADRGSGKSRRGGGEEGLPDSDNSEVSKYS